MAIIKLFLVNILILSSFAAQAKDCGEDLDFYTGYRGYGESSDYSKPPTKLEFGLLNPIWGIDTRVVEKTYIHAKKISPDSVFVIFTAKSGKKFKKAIGIRQAPEDKDLQELVDFNFRVFIGKPDQWPGKVTYKVMKADKELCHFEQKITDQVPDYLNDPNN